MDYTEILDYRDGELYWKVKTGSRALAGQRAGTLGEDGYRKVRYKRKGIREHRIIYEMHHGPIPNGMEIDHINGIRDDNRVENLRAIPHSLNTQNNTGAGKKGFSFHKASGKFEAYLGLNGKMVYLGLHETPVDAHAAYLRAKREHHINETYRHG